MLRVYCDVLYIYIYICARSSADRVMSANTAAWPIFSHKGQSVSVSPYGSMRNGQLFTFTSLQLTTYGRGFYQSSALSTLTIKKISVLAYQHQQIFPSP